MLTGVQMEEQLRINALCRTNNVKFISGSVISLLLLVLACWRAVASLALLVEVIVEFLVCVILQGHDGFAGGDDCGLWRRASGF